MTDTDELVAALAEGLHIVYCIDRTPHPTCRRYLPSANVDATAIVASLAPEARDKMLLGFAVAELPGDWVMVANPCSTHISTWLGEVTPQTQREGTGPTPLAAVEAVLKEVRDGGVGPMVDAEGNVTDD